MQTTCKCISDYTLAGREFAHDKTFGDCMHTCMHIYIYMIYVYKICIYIYANIHSNKMCIYF